MKNTITLPRVAPISAVLLTFLMACSHNGDSPAPSTPTTSYKGNVTLFDEFGNKVSDKSGVIISVVDQPNATATTDATGAFSLAVPQGTRRLNFSKPGYGTYLSSALTVESAPIVAAQSVALGQVSSTYLTYIRSWEKINYGDYYRFMGRINAPSTATQVRSHRIFYALAKDVSPTNYKATSLFNGSLPDTGGNPSWYWVSDSVSRATITGLNAGPADKVYAVVYGDNPAAATYADPVSGRTIYPAVSVQKADAFECVR